MSYIVKVHRNASAITGGSSVGHVYLEFIDTNSSELSKQVGFNINHKKSSNISDIINRLSIYGEVENDRKQLNKSVESRSFTVTKEQYDAMLEATEIIKVSAENNNTLYDLFDNDTGISDYNCVTFAEHILRIGGQNVELGWYPDLVINNSYNATFWNDFYTLIEKVASINEPAGLTFNNGYISIENGGWDSHTTIPSFNTTIDISLNRTDNNLFISINGDEDLDNKDFNIGVMELVSITNINKLTLNTQTYNVVNENNKLLIRNAIDDIPKVSFLLSHIDIDAGDILDIGDQGLYSVKDGDTMSQIAEAKGMTTQALLKLNTWLIDEGKVHFDQDKVLVETDASNLTNKDHVYQGTSAEDRLIDKNGGFDTYITGNKDTIIDSDGQGLINFNGIDLTGTKTKVKDEDEYEDDDFSYVELDGTLLITSKTTVETITIENWGEVVKTTDKTKEALGIKLSEGGDIVVNTESNSALEVLEQMPIPVKLDRVIESGEELVVQIGYYRNILEYVPVGNPYWVAQSRHYNSYTGTWYTTGGYWKQPTKTIVIGQGFNSYGEVTFSEGEQEKEFIFRWNDDTYDQGNQSYPLIPKIDETNSTYSEGIQVAIDKSGTGTIIDDDPRTRIDPLILDTSKDGFITTTPLSESTTYFDITNILTCKHFHTTKSLHVRNKIKQKGARYEVQPKVA